jgi:precorrin-6A/cobalt-precorrin-6A reductase
MKKILILGGTGDATQLAAKAATIPKVEIISSLAGRTNNPISPTGNVRIGGFGGQTGLTDYIKQMNIDILIDATHPFAAQISFNAAIAAESTNIPRLMLIRPTWQKLPEDKWIEVDTVESAAATLHHAKRVFLTVGKQQLPAFAKLDNIWFIMRLIELPLPNTAVPQGIFLCDRGPFCLDNEREILLKYNIDTIVSKNSGGDATIAKIIAARELGIPVVMVNRPPTPLGEKVSNVDEALIWLRNKLGVS